MTAIIALILVIIIGICKDDYSLLISLGKIIGIGALVFGSLWLVACYPFLIVVIVGIILIICLLSLTSQNNKNFSDDNDVYTTNKLNEKTLSVPTSNNNLTDFQIELEQNTKTLEQTAEEEWEKEKEQIINEVHSDYRNIREIILNKARSGQYIYIDGCKYISIDYNCPYLLKCVDREYSYNPTGRIGTRNYNKNEKAIYQIKKLKQYYFYIDAIKELSINDNMNIFPFFNEVDEAHQTENRITLPYTYKHQWKVPTHRIKAYLKCSIKY